MSSGEPSDKHAVSWLRLAGTAASFRTSAILLAAAELDLFSQIAADGSTSGQIAERAGVAELGVRLLLNALVGQKLVTLVDGRYVVPEEFRPLLTRGPHCMLDALLQYQRECQVWMDMARLLRDREGTLRSQAATMLEPDAAGYLTAVRWANHAPARELVRRLAWPISKAKRALDIGGGQGDYARQLLAANPELHVALLDLPAALEATRDMLGKIERLELIAADVQSYRPEPTYDLVLLSDLLHYFGRAGKRRVLEVARAALAPDSLLVVSKFTVSDDATTPPSATMFSLKVHLKKPDAYLETDAEMVELLKEVGLQAVSVVRLDSGKSLVMGRSPPDVRSPS